MIRSHLIGPALLVGLTLAVQADIKAAGGEADVVIQWNQRLQETIPPSAGLRMPRYYAMMHIAMFDAVNAIEREYEPYHAEVRGASGSPSAAAAQAAHDVLVGLNPAATTGYDALLAAQLGSSPDGFVRRGAQTGALVAAQILAWRLNDGWSAAPLAYGPPALPGLWQPTAPGMVAAFTFLQSATPMALLTSTQFLPAPPPSLSSERYATDLAEVEAIGSVTSASRTPMQTEIARMWAGVGTTTTLFAIWNNIARDAAIARHLSLLDAARVFALVNTSIHDTLQTTQVSKFVYSLWRPVTAIQNADQDLNPGTTANPTWASLIANPPYPSYGGNMAGVGASAATALRLALGTDAVPVSATWSTPTGPVVHHFQGFWEAAQEQSESRIYGGIHYRFDQVAGQAAARSVANFVFANYMTPRKNSH